jgi:hypothetical protein
VFVLIHGQVLTLICVDLQKVSQELLELEVKLRLGIIKSEIFKRNSTTEMEGDLPVNRQQDVVYHRHQQHVETIIRESYARDTADSLNLGITITGGKQRCIGIWCFCAD